MWFQKICFAQTHWRSAAHGYTKDFHHFPHRWHHRASQVSRPCSWLLPAPSHSQKLSNTWRPSGKSQLGTIAEALWPSSSVYPLPGHCCHAHTHWPRLAQQWNKAWVGSNEGYRPHFCQGLPRLPLPGTLSKCSTDTEAVHWDWMRWGGRWGGVKNGRKQWAGQGGEKEGLTQR